MNKLNELIWMDKMVFHRASLIVAGVTNSLRFRDRLSLRISFFVQSVLQCFEYSIGGNLDTASLVETTELLSESCSIEGYSHLSQKREDVGRRGVPVCVFNTPYDYVNWRKHFYYYGRVPVFSSLILYIDEPNFAEFYLLRLLFCLASSTRYSFPHFC